MFVYTGTCGQPFASYVGANQNVYAIIDNCPNTVQNLTTTTGAPLARANSALDGYVTPDGILHVDFVGSDNHAHELYDQGGTWFSVDLG